MTGAGRVSLVGAGPGDPDLLTLRGARRLGEADLVLYDALASERMRPLAPRARWFYVGKRACRNSIDQDVLNRLMIKHASRGRHVVRLKCGDPFVFGRGGEEVLALSDAGVPVEVVPGLSTATAAPALAGIPVTHRGVAHDFTVVSGHLPPGHPDLLTDWDAVARLHGTLLLMMAVENAPAIADALLAGGRKPETPVAVVCDGSMPGERTVLSTLGSLAGDLERDEVQPPAIIVVGDVVAVARPEHYNDRRG
jgi:uroporphyrin-III C-methyltransferase/precorrin-2 dehydrogenase/sirohydrochlorin ferrochelatase